MPFTTGSADTAVDLQIKLNAHLTANGWTKLAGETRQEAASPIAARYWRLVVTEVESTGFDYHRIELLHFRETVGGPNVATNGANWSFSSLGSGTGADLVSGTNFVRTAMINDDLSTWTYDFGAPQIVREMFMQVDVDTEAPRDFTIQWSDDGYTWTTMAEYTNQLWNTNESRVFTFGDGALYASHFSATRARRTGYNTDLSFSQKNQGLFAWQGPGYDASRRVYINCTTNYSLGTITERWILGAGVDFDINSIGPWGDDALGADTGATPRFLLPLGPFTYWIYSNSLRVIVIVKNGVDDYVSMYAGFMKAFAVPDDYPFPLFVGASSFTDDAVDTDNSYLSSFCDPGYNGCARFRRWDGVWQSVQNRFTSTLDGLYVQAPGYWTWPYHGGETGDLAFPQSSSGDNDAGDGDHWMNKVTPTAQGETFMWPVVVWSAEFGAIGALDGVYALPRAGLYSAEQVLLIGGQNYRVFKNRGRNGGNAYFAIRED